MRQTDQGFTLVETLVAVLIFAIASLAVSQMMYYSTQAVSENNAASQAIAVAQSALEEIRTLDYADMATDDTGETVTTPDGRIFTVKWTVSEDSPGAGMKTVVVNVTWNEKGGERTHELETIFSKISA